MSESGDDGGMGRAWLVLSLVDARNNCRDYGATVELYLRGGQTIVGKLDSEMNQHPEDTVHLKMRLGGWATILTSEIIAVEVRK